MSKPTNANTIHPYDQATARAKARYGRRNWIWWQDKAGNNRAAVATRETVKRCLLECGPEKVRPKHLREWNWFFFHASCGTCAVGYWAWGCLLLRNLKYHDRTSAW